MQKRAPEAKSDRSDKGQSVHWPPMSRLASHNVTAAAAATFGEPECSSLFFSLFSNVSAHLVVVDPLLLSRPLVHHQQRQTLKLNTMKMLQIDKSWKSFMCLCGGGGGGGGRRRHKIETAAAAVAEKTKDKAIVGER